MARIPEGVRLYAVGDLDGCARLLCNLHELIVEDANRTADESRNVVYLGGYIDRGPDYRDVIDLAIAGPGEAFECAHLKGNHEAMLLDFLAGLDNIDLWRQNGGANRSYGVEDERDQMSCGAIPAAHCEFYESLRLYPPKAAISSSTRACVLASHSTGSRMKICCGFAILFSIGRRMGYTVVHGHSTVAAPDIRPNRINLDTGAVWRPSDGDGVSRRKLLRAAHLDAAACGSWNS